MVSAGKIVNQLLNVQFLLCMVRIDKENKSGWDSDRSKPALGIITEPGKQTEADYVSFVVHTWPVLPLSQRMGSCLSYLCVSRT